MTGISHAVAGITAGVIISDKFNINPIIGIGACTLGSIIVDIDAKHSLINKILIPLMRKYTNIIKIILGVGLQFTKIPMLMYLGCILILSSISAKLQLNVSLFGGLSIDEYHRTIFHSPELGLLLLGAPLLFYKINLVFTIPYIAGLLLHYFMDSCTDGGLYFIIFRIFIRMPIHFKSGNKIIEFAVVAGCLAFLIYFKGFTFFCKV